MVELAQVGKYKICDFMWVKITLLQVFDRTVVESHRNYLTGVREFIGCDSHGKTKQGWLFRFCGFVNLNTSKRIINVNTWTLRDFQQKTDKYKKLPVRATAHPLLENFAWATPTTQRVHSFICLDEWNVVAFFDTINLTQRTRRRKSIGIDQQ